MKNQVYFSVNRRKNELNFSCTLNSEFAKYLEITKHIRDLLKKFSNISKTQNSEILGCKYIEKENVIFSSIIKRN